MFLIKVLLNFLYVNYLYFMFLIKLFDQLYDAIVVLFIFLYIFTM